MRSEITGMLLTSLNPLVQSSSSRDALAALIVERFAASKTSSRAIKLRVPIGVLCEVINKGTDQN
jgi:hypothetical protein